MGFDFEYEPEITVFVRTGGGAADEARRAREDREYFFARRIAGVAEVYALLCIEGGSDSVNALPGTGAGAGNPGEQHRAGDDSI